jgi:hypothetical protein
MYKLLLGLGCQAISRVKNQDVDPSDMPFLCEGNGPTKNNKSRARFWIPLKRTERERERERDF